MIIIIIIISRFREELTSSKALVDVAMGDILRDRELNFLKTVNTNFLPTVNSQALELNEYFGMTPYLNID